jgi:hypothetical protein
VDLCDALPGVAQCDTDGDGFGNPCDGDFDNDLLVGPTDFGSYFVPDFVAGVPTPGIGTDMDCDGVVGPVDFTAYFIPQFIKASPGP